jgi:hypothetical protein
MQGELAWAVRLWGVQKRSAKRLVRLPPIERADYDPAVAAVRDHLGERAFMAAWAQGRRMTAEQILTLR